MEYLTIGGIAGGLLVLAAGVFLGGSYGAFASPHGLLIVGGGTLFAAFINSSRADIGGLLRALRALFAPPEHASPQSAKASLIELCRLARQRGVRAVQDSAVLTAADPFLARAFDICLTLSDQSLARAALEREINMMRIRHRETGNILRAMGILAPMFGLLGTLIGIISVLGNLSDATQAGRAMAVAISSAFYGILFSNLFFVPLANKLRARSIAEGLVRELMMTGMLDIVFSQRVPVALELELDAFLENRLRGADGGERPRAGG
jgi:chemotaxis protein MotA